MAWTLRFPQVSPAVICLSVCMFVCLFVCLSYCPYTVFPDGTLPVHRRRRAHAFGGGDHQSCLKPLTEDENNDGNESDGDAGNSQREHLVSFFLNRSHSHT